MTRLSPLLVCALAIAAGACGPKRPETPKRRSADLVVLLPDPNTGHVGRARAGNAQGTLDLATARAGARVTPGAPPDATTLTEHEVERVFGAALASLPPAPEHFTLYFRFESEVLTDESRRLVQDVLTAVKRRPMPEVLAIGHTDTTGQPSANVELGLRRARAVRTLLVDAGLSTTAIDVTSHGEADLLVRTADGVSEPRNRRVEITVR